MPRKINQPHPSTLHASGQARVSIKNQEFYLGEHGSRESRILYAMLLARYERKSKPPSQQWFAKKKEKVWAESNKRARGKTVKSSVTVGAVVTLWRMRVEEIYAGNPAQYSKHNTICDLIEREYGSVSVDDFRPAHLKELRAFFVIKGAKRRSVNEQTRRIVEMFRYAAGEGDLIEPEIVTRLENVALVRRGQQVAEAADSAGCSSSVSRYSCTFSVEPSMIRCSVQAFLPSTVTASSSWMMQPIRYQALATTVRTRFRMLVACCRILESNFFKTFGLGEGGIQHRLA